MVGIVYISAGGRVVCRGRDVMAGMVYISALGRADELFVEGDNCLSRKGGTLL